MEALDAQARATICRTERSRAYSRAVTQFRQFIARGDLTDRIDPRHALLLNMALTGFPIAFPQLTRLVTGIGPESRRFQSEWNDCLRIIMRQLKPAPAARRRKSCRHQGTRKMWIVQLALRRPVTIAVMAALMLLLGIVSLGTMNFDIFPAIDVPVVDLVWNYPGLSAEEMEQRVVNISERASSTTVNGVDHIESTSLNGIGLLKFYFQPGADTALAIAQLTSVSEAIKNILPPGINPPSVIDYNATNVPVVYIVYSSELLSQSRIYDFGANFGRLFLFTIPGLSTPAPFGGAQRQVMVNIDPSQMYARGVSPADVVNALQQQNVIIPGGTAKIGNTEYDVVMNGSPVTVAALNRLPIKYVDGAPVYIGDVAKVSDSARGADRRGDGQRQSQRPTC